MFRDEYEAVAESAKSRVALLRDNPAGYFISSMLAGVYVGLGIILIFTIGASLKGAVYTRIVYGASFPVALSLVIMAGSELFTGNNLFMTAGVLKRKINISQAARLLGVCYIGNLIGSAVLAIIFCGGGFLSGETGVFFAQAALAKMSLTPLALICRGILCNFLVCVAIWCAFRMKSESGKLIIIFWCIYTFIASGFEHSVANMTLFAISLLSPSGVAVTMSLAARNLLFVTLGNMIGGIVFTGLAYYIIGLPSIKKLDN